MVEPEGVQVQGLCRFSYPCRGGFKKYHEDLAERRAALYDPKRLDARTLLFEQVLLPGIAAQTDPDFTLHILLGEDLPEPWRGFMEDYLTAVPQLKAHWRGPEDHRTACRQVLWGGRDENKAIVAEFRLDDDDAVAVNYVRHLRVLYRKLSRLAGANGRVALDHGKGVVLQGNPDGTVDARVLLTHCWSAGLAVYLRPDDDATIMDFPHHRIWQRMPFVNLTETAMFIRCDHGTNDSRTPAAAPAAIPEEQMPELLMRRFHVDLDEIRKAWADLRASY